MIVCHYSVHNEYLNVSVNDIIISHIPWTEFNRSRTRFTFWPVRLFNGSPKGRLLISSFRHSLSIYLETCEDRAEYPKVYKLISISIIFAEFAPLRVVVRSLKRATQILRFWCIHDTEQTDLWVRWEAKCSPNYPKRFEPDATFSRLIIESRVLLYEQPCIYDFYNFWISSKISYTLPLTIIKIPF